MSSEPAPSATASRPSLTERRKAETRKSIANVACDLFISDGFDEVTVDNIAQDAGVSLRTFYRYFRGKEDVLGPIVDEGMAWIADGLAARPAEEPIAVALRHAFEELAPVEEEPRYRPMLGLMLGVPALRARWLDSLRTVEDAFARAVRTRLGDEPSELEVQLTAAAIVLALRFAFEHAAAGDAEVPIADVLSEALDHLRAGARL